MPYSFKQDISRLLKAMDMATSLLNRRLWDLRVVGDDRVEFYSAPDPAVSRLLPREAVISCGAALYNLRLAIQVAGRDPNVWIIPSLDLQSGLLTRMTREPTLLASVEIMTTRTAPANIAVQEMYEAIWLRRAASLPDQQLPVPLPILVEMQNAAAHERGWLRILTGSQRRHLLRVIERASRDPLLGTLAELHPGSSAGDGQAPEERLSIARPDFWRMDAIEDVRHMQLMSLSTDDDRPLDWLRAGEAMQRALLNGTRFSMSAEGGRSTPYRQRLTYGPFFKSLRFRPRGPVPPGYAVEATFLTQFLELADLKAQLAGLKAPAGVDLATLEPGDLEALELADPRDRRRQEDGRTRWPWNTFMTGIPQVVMRVCFAPAERAVELGDIPPVPVPRSSEEGLPTEPSSSPQPADD